MAITTTQDFGDYTVTIVINDDGSRTATYIWKPGTVGANQQSIIDKAQAALVTNAAALAQPDPTQNNQTFLGIVSPSNAQNAAQIAALTRQINILVAQVLALTRQNNALIRIIFSQFESTSGT